MNKFELASGTQNTNLGHNVLEKYFFFCSLLLYKNFNGELNHNQFSKDNYLMEVYKKIVMLLLRVEW